MLEKLATDSRKKLTAGFINLGGGVGRVLNITHSSHNITGVRKKTIGREIIIGPNAIKFVALAIFAIFAIVYLTQSTAGANRSVKVRDLDAKQTQLQTEKERLEVEQTRLKSLKEIDGSVQQNVLEPASTADTASTPAPTPAKPN